MQVGEGGAADLEIKILGFEAEQPVADRAANDSRAAHPAQGGEDRG